MAEAFQSMVKGHGFRGLLVEGLGLFRSACSMFRAYHLRIYKPPQVSSQIPSTKILST